MTFLEEILDSKRRRVDAARSATDAVALRRAAFETRASSPPNRLSQAIGRDGVSVIAEIKRASPSKGIISPAVDVAETARAYERGGAAAISVLTEEDRFLGSIGDLKTARAATSLPILRKDFVFDEFQILEAAAAGADAILLIVAMLDDERLKELHCLADAGLGLDALVEVHTAAELERAANLGPRLIGVNNRNLATFDVSLDVSRELIGSRPDGSLMIAESGISTRFEIRELCALGFDGFLIGESLMRSFDAGRALSEFRSPV